MPPSVPPPEPPRIVQIQQQKAVNHFADAARLAIASNSRSSLEQQKSNLNSEFSNSAIPILCLQSRLASLQRCCQAGRSHFCGRTEQRIWGTRGQGDTNSRGAEEQGRKKTRGRGDSGTRGHKNYSHQKSASAYARTSFAGYSFADASAGRRKKNL